MKKQDKIERIMDLSPMQEGILFDVLVSKDPELYCEQTIIDLSGKINISLFERSLQELSRRYDVLRALFLHKNVAKLRQVILRERPLPFQFEDIQNTEGGWENTFEEFLVADRTRNFDLVKDPLLRLTLLQVGTHQWKVVWSVHHIIMDGWCTGLLIKDFIQIYETLNKGQELHLPHVPQYHTFIDWLGKQDNEASQLFWKGYINKFDSATFFPSFPTNENALPKTITSKFVISEADVNQITNVCSENKLSVNHFLQTLWALQLSRYNQDANPIFGTVVSGRPADLNGVEEMVGLFINTLPVALEIDQNQSFLKHAQQVASIYSNWAPHAHYPLHEIQKISNMPQLVDHLFVYQSVPFDSQLEEGTQSAELKIEGKNNNESNGFDLVVYVVTGKAITIEFVYNEHKYPQWFMEQTAEQMAALLQTALSNPNALISSLWHKNSDQKEHQTNPANYPDQDNVATIFKSVVERFSDRTALKDEKQAWTYTELDKKSNQIAHALIAKGIEKEDVVGLLMEPSNEMICSLLGVVKAGATYLPIDANYPIERAQFMLEDASAKTIITTPEFVSKANLLKVEVETLVSILSESSEIEKHPQTPVNVAIDPDQVVYIIFTSGSTGRPKGCRITHRNVVRLLHNDRHDFDFSEEDVWILGHAYYFDFSVWEMYGALLYGGKLIVPPRDEVKYVAHFYNWVSENKVTVLNQTPLAFNFFIEEAHFSTQPLDALRYVIFGGDRLDPEQLVPWSEKYPLDKVALINMFGITETTVHVTYHKLTAEDLAATGVSPIGRPLPETTVHILDQNLQPLPNGVFGEMYVGGTGVCKGYLNREELTNERFITNPFQPKEKLYKSGDLARWLNDGTLEYKGRKDFQVKIRGHRIELGEVQNVIRQAKGVKDAAVIARQNTHGENDLVAYFVPKDDLSADELRLEVALSLPDYMLPSWWVIIAEIPLTSQGKLDKKALPDPTKNQGKKSVKKTIPKNETESAIKRIWETVLDVEGVGITDNFFTSGGDSLKAIRLITQINKTLSVNYKVADIFSAQTIEALSELREERIDNTAKNVSEKGNQLIEQLKQSILDDPEETAKLPKKWEDIYPMASIETGMIFSSMLQPDDPIYYDQTSSFLWIKDMEVFLEALRLMVQKHDILRTEYYMHQFKEPLKIVLSEIELPVSIDQISHLNPTEQGAHIRQYQKEQDVFRLSFDGDLLWWLKMFEVKPQQYHLTFSCHHAILDGWSVSSLSMELVNLAKREDLFELKQLEPLKASYRDYAAIALGRTNSRKASNYWNEKLKGYVRSKLPFNLSGKKSAQTNGVHMILNVMGAEVNDQIEKLANDLGVTYKSICLAAYAWLMHVTASENDLVSGVVSNDRPEIEDGDKILGCFLNTIPFRVDFTAIQQPDQLIQSLNAYLLESKEHELYLADIANIIGDRASSQNPMFDCIFNFTDFHVLNDIADGNQKIQRGTDKPSDFNIAQDNQMTNTLLDLEVDKTFGQFSFLIKYSQAYFTEDQARRALDLYGRIIHLFLENPLRKLTISDLLSDQDRQAILYDFNDTIRPFPENLGMHQLFEEQVERVPNHSALAQDGAEMSYAALNEKANRIAHHLIEKGIQPAENVGILAERHFDLIAGLMGILKAGGAYVPIDPSYPADRQNYILENSKVALVLTDVAYEVEQENRTVQFLRISDLSENGSTENPNVLVDPHALAYTIYTSGSTGRPKGVMITHHAAVNLIHWVNTTFEVGTNDRLLFITSVCFDLSVYDIFGILGAGATVVIAKQEQVRNPESLRELMVSEKITFWDSVPTTMNYLIDTIEDGDKNYQQNDLRLVFMSGDWIPVDLSGRISKFFPKAQNISLGGATEGTVWSNFYPIEKVMPNQVSIPYGKPIDNNFFYILDEALQPVPKEVAGELFIGGIGVAKGYANDPEKTAASFLPDPFSKLDNAMMYRTGDLGRLMADGNMEFLGRKDFQVKIRGFRVELGEIENQLQQHPKVHRAVVLAKDGEGSKFLCAYVVPEGKVDKEALRSHLSQTLPEYMLPTFYVYLDQLPITSNGKIDRKSLPEPNRSEVDAAVFVAPEGDLEEALAEIWKSILKIDHVGRTDHFFELGAHSLHAGILVSRIQKKLGLTLSLKDLFASPRLVEQAAMLSTAEQGEAVVIPVLPEQASYDVSYAQQRLWVIDQIEDGNSHEYNLPITLNIKGSLNQEAFVAAFDAIIARHESLRTVFEVEEGRPVQIILPTAKFELEQADLRGKERALAEKISLDTGTKAFDLKNGPLMRGSLVRLEDNQWQFTFVMHHIISDGWSMKVLVEELFYLYDTFSKGELPALPKLRIQYKDFAHWQNQQVEQDADHSGKNYWHSILEEPAPLLDLPTDFPRPATLSRKGAKHDFNFDVHTTQRIRAFCRAEGVSTYMFLVAAVKTLLYRYTGETDLLVGSPVAGRGHTDLEDQIGFFVNTVVIRDQIKPQNAFKTFVKEVGSTVTNALDYQHYPFDLLVSELGLERHLNRNPLFDVVVVMQNMTERDAVKSEGKAASEDLEMERLNKENTSSKFDLAFSFFDANELLLSLEYSTELFLSDRIERMVMHLQELIWSALDDASVAVNALNIIPKAEKALLVETFNPNRDAPAFEESLVDRFEANAIQFATKNALEFEDESYTYAELNAASNKVAHRLIQEGIEPGDMVALLFDRHPSMVISILGVIKAGAAWMPVDPEYPKERIDYMLITADVKLLIHADELVVPKLETKILPFSVVIQNENIHNPPAHTTPESLAYIIFTSGSTGRPKGVMIAHKAVTRAMMDADYLNIDASHRFLMVSSYAFDGAMIDLFGALLNGGTLVITSRETLLDPVQLSNFIRDNHITSAFFASVMFNAVVDGAPEGLSGMKCLMAGGERLSPKHVAKILDVLQPGVFHNCYGPTESCIYTTTSQINELVNDVDTAMVGTPLPQTAIDIYDANRQLLPIGIPGEICISGNGLARGYLKAPELTAQKFVENPVNGQLMYRSGDIGFWRSDGKIEIVGRVDHQIKLRGYRIEIGEIENALMRHEKIESAFVRVRTDANEEPVLVAWMVSDSEFEDAEMRTHLQLSLPNYMIPAAFIRIDEVPMTRNGKLDDARLPEIGVGAATAEFEAPINELEAHLIEIWKEILGKGRIGRKDHFFALGGNSLKAIQVINRVRAQYEVELSVREIFTNDTIEAFADTVLQLQLNALEDGDALLLELEGLDD